MQDKQVVQFLELPMHYCKSDYMIYCKACHTYNIRNGKPCYKCGSDKGLVTVEEIANKTVKRDFFNRTCFILIVYAALFLLSMTFSNIGWVSLYTLICLILNGVIYKLFKKDMVIAEFDNHMTSNYKQIKKNLKGIFKGAKNKIEEQRYLEAYEDLRYLGMLIDGTSIRLSKIICLKAFRLRKDLPLEMKEVLLEECNQYLIYYIYEVAQIKKELIDEATILYILKYKEQVLNFPEGEKIIAVVIEAILKSKMLTDKYAHELYVYMDYLPKERAIRLCKIKDCISDHYLRQQLLDKIRLKYGQDEAFEKYL